MEEELREQCWRDVRRILAQRGWELVEDEAAFIEEVLAEVQFRIQNSRRPLEKIIEDATVNRYCHLWHAACGADGTFRQRRAFTELHRYLYPIALYCAKHDRHIAEECAQEALINVWQHLAQVRDPGSFASWARTIVSRQVKAKFKEQAQKVVEADSGKVTWQFKEITEADLRARRGADGVGTETWGIGDRPDLSVSQEPRMTDEMRIRVEMAIRRCLRSKRQQAVIIGLFLDQKSFKEVADALDTTPQNVSVLKTRALKRLRECQGFLEVLENLM
ncbi:MAG TPA: sigma-70 family RNA polymerase sigma factor [Anaerolineae bacterium]|nr:sigma-70 family RNA polymerase sigma factor [Anaerolineae bacterium]